MADGSKLMVPVSWSSNSIDTSVKGAFTFKGVVQGYSGEVNLSVDVAERGNSNENISHGSSIIEKNGWQYFIDEFEGEIYKVKSDGTGKTKLCDDRARYIYSMGDWIYYNNFSDDGKLYKVNIDGSQRSLVCSDSMETLSIVGDWVFYSNCYDNNCLYKVKIDGTNKIKLTEDEARGINVMGNWIYYLNVSDEYRLYRIDKDGNERSKLYNNTLARPIVSGKTIYAKEGSVILKMNTDGSNVTKIPADSSILDYTVSGNKIYYYDKIDYKLRVMNTDGTERKVLCEDKLSNDTLCANTIQVIGDWIYYFNVSDYFRLYKIRKDGTGRQRGNADTPIKSIEDYSVSVKLGEGYNLPSTLPATVINDAITSVPVIWNADKVDTSKLGTTIYEGTVSGYSNKVRLTVTVTDKEILANEPNQNYVAKSGDWIIINNLKMKSDSSEKGYYFNDWISNEKLVGDWVYYASSAGIKKVKIDGTGAARICNDNASIIGILGDWIYYVNNNDGGKIYKIRLCGLDKTKVSDDKVDDAVLAADGWIYYENKIDQYDLNKGALYKIKTDGTVKVKLADDAPSCINIVGDWIYYQSSYNTIHKIKTDGSSRTFISNVTQWCSMKVVGDWIYLDNNYKLSKMMTDGTKQSQLCNMQSLYINILDNWVYFLGSDGKYYRIRPDGSDKQLIY